MNNSKHETVYTSDYRQKFGFFQTWKIMFKNIINSKELIWQLFRRDFLMSYKKSIFGLSWIVISPLIGVVSWIILNATNILQPGDVGIPYPAFVLLSSSIWGLFMGFYDSASNTLNAGSSFIMQVKYPHEVLLVKQVAQQLANFTITFCLNIIVLVVFGVLPSVWILAFPVLVLPLFFLGAGIGLIVSVLGVVTQDLSKIATTVLGLVFYITPIVYSLDNNNETLQQIMKYNPLTYLIDGIRSLVVYGQMNHPLEYIVVTILSFIFFLLTWRLFFVSEHKVIERML